MEPNCDTGMLEPSQTLVEFAGLPQVILNNTFMCVELLAIAVASCIIFKPLHLLYRGGAPGRQQRRAPSEDSSVNEPTANGADDTMPLAAFVAELNVPSPLTVLTVTDVFTDLVRGWSSSFDLPPFR